LLRNYLNAIALHTTREAIEDIISCIKTCTCMRVIMEWTLDIDLTTGSMNIGTVVLEHRYDIG
jgi:hypothetical protein